jgi:hypothetical protein
MGEITFDKRPELQSGFYQDEFISALLAKDFGN